MNFESKEGIWELSDDDREFVHDLLGFVEQALEGLRTGHGEFSCTSTICDIDSIDELLKSFDDYQPLLTADRKSLEEIKKKGGSEKYDVIEKVEVWIGKINKKLGRSNSLTT